MCFQIFLERRERWRAADVCRKRVPDFSCLKLERSVSSRFEVSFGDFQQFFAAEPKSSRGLVGARKAHTYNYADIITIMCFSCKYAAGTERQKTVNYVEIINNYM